MSLSKFTKSLTGLPPAVRENPPIPFVSKARKTENPDENADKTEYIKLEFYMDVLIFPITNRPKSTSFTFAFATTPQVC
jgi:hypothetical protein